MPGCLRISTGSHLCNLASLVIAVDRLEAGRFSLRLVSDIYLGRLAGQVVEDHHVARLQGRCQLGLDVGVEDLAVHGLIDHPRRDEAIAAQAGDEGLRRPVSERRPGLQAGPAARAPRRRVILVVVSTPR